MTTPAASQQIWLTRAIAIPYSSARKFVFTIQQQISCRSCFFRLGLARVNPLVHSPLMDTANNTKTFEMLRCGTTDWYMVRNTVTGTETIALRKGAAQRVLRALRG